MFILMSFYPSVCCFYSSLVVFVVNVVMVLVLLVLSTLLWFWYCCWCCWFCCCLRTPKFQDRAERKPIAQQPYTSWSWWFSLEHVRYWLGDAVLYVLSAIMNVKAKVRSSFSAWTMAAVVAHWRIAEEVFCRVYSVVVVAAIRKDSICSHRHHLQR